MPDDSTEKWPHFEIVTFSAPTSISHGWDDELLRNGVPKAMLGRSYEALPELMLVEDPTVGPLVCFGSSGLHGFVCLEPRSGQVVDIVYVPVATPTMPAGMVRPAKLVNSSLDHFIASVRAVLGRFPFYGRTADDESAESAEIDEYFDEMDRVAAELKVILHAIDPAAVEDPDGFWMTFVDDVQMGDFATEDILSDLDE